MAQARRRNKRLLTPMMVENEKLKSAILFVLFFLLFFIGVFSYARGGRTPW